MLICKSYNTSRGYIDQHKVALVCSARSGSTKALGTTNLLLRASAEALHRNTINISNGNGNGNGNGGNKDSLPDNSGTGTVTPVTRGLFGAYGMSPNHRSVSQSPPSSPISRSSSDFRGSLTFTPIIGKGEKVHQVPDFVNTVELLRQEHLNAARECVTKHEEILQELEEEIERDCDWLTSFLYALKACLALLIDCYH